jgi:hypothetical protein
MAQHMHCRPPCYNVQIFIAVTKSSEATTYLKRKAVVEGTTPYFD